MNTEGKNLGKEKSPDNETQKLVKNKKQNLNGKTKMIDSKKFSQILLILLPIISIMIAIGIYFLSTIYLEIESQISSINMNIPTIVYYFVGVVVGIAVVVILWTLTMLAYFKIRKNFAQSKYIVEIIFVASILLVGVGISIGLSLQKSEDVHNGFLNGLKSLFLSIYSAIGKMGTFEGIDVSNGATTGLEIAFYGWALYAGLSFLCIITAKASYEFFSFARLILQERKDIYVFTALTEETLLLAQSIEKNSKKTACKIVFAGPRLDPFDKKNDLCREVMARNYIYWSHMNIDSKKSIARMLYLNNRNISYIGSRRFVIFAFEMENNLPKEEDNMNLVFKDIENRMQRNDSLCIEYYILTKGNINYEAYISKNKKLKTEYKHKKGKRCKDYENRFVINVWSESNAVAKSAIKMSNKFILNKIELWEGEGLKSIEKNSDNTTENEEDIQRNYDKPDLNIWCLGFGETAQSIAKALYCQSAYVDKSQYSSYVKIDAYDIRMEQIAGLFKKENPMSICLFPNDKNIEEKKQQLDSTIYNLSSALIESEMMYPVYEFHNTDCRSNDFIQKFDNATGTREDVKMQPDVNQLDVNQPDIFIIATGDDHRNVRIANAIIQDTLNEYIGKTPKNKKQAIFISIQDEKNNDLIITGRDGEVKNDESNQQNPLHLVIDCGDKSQSILEVFIVGNKSSIYTNDIIDVSRASKYHNDYDLMYKLIDTETEIKNAIIKVKNCKDGEKIKNMQFDASNILSILENRDIKKDDIKYIDNILQAVKCVIDNAKKERDDEPDNIVASVVRYIVNKVKGNRETETCDVSGAKESLLKRIISLVRREDPDKQRIIKYNKIDIWKKESNSQAELFGAILAGLDKPTIQENTLYRLSQIEHNRWCRAHMTAGWYYSKDEKNYRKQHDCIIPYNLVKLKSYFYEIINISLAANNNNKNAVNNDSDDNKGA